MAEDIWGLVQKKESIPYEQLAPMMGERPLGPLSPELVDAPGRELTTYLNGVTLTKVRTLPPGQYSLTIQTQDPKKNAS